MRKQSKNYQRPGKPFDKIRIEEENVIREKYGLKNKLEIWKADAAVLRIRNLAKGLITKSEEEKIAFIERLVKKGFKVEKIADALALTKEDWLNRRLQTLVFQKGLANTPKQARQIIVHKHVFVGGRIVNIPSYQVDLGEESSLRCDLVFKKKESKSKMDEIKKEILEGEESVEEIVGEDLIKEIEKEMEILG